MQKVKRTAEIQRKNIIDVRYLLNNARAELEEFNDDIETEHRNLVSSLADLVLKSIEK